MSIPRVLPLALAALLTAGCATYPAHPPAIYQQEAAPAPIGVLAGSGQTVVFESPITEAERGDWVRHNVVQQPYEPPRQVEVVRVVERPVYHDRPVRYVSPVHLNVGYSWGGHHRRHHGGWHTGLGWSLPLVW